MSLQEYVYLVQRVDQQIRMKATGSPKVFAQRMGVSERKLYALLQELKNQFGCPIVYSRLRESYYYKAKGRLRLEFFEEEPQAASSFQATA